MWRHQHRRTNMLLLPCLVLSFIDRANSISCFQCNSYVDEGCADLQATDTNSRYYQICEENSLERTIFCRKIHLQVKMEFEAGGVHERIIRSCAWMRNDRKKDCYRKSDKDHEETVCECFHDGCNSATTIAAVPIIGLASAILLWLK